MKLFCSGKSRKRRIKGSASSGPKTGDDGGFDSSDFERSDMLTPAASSTPSKFDISMNKDDSKLPPLAGTLEERRAQFQEKSGLQRNVEQLLAPTPVGEEPKIVQLAKAVTWGAVILLVVLEIVVSVKVGGAPFDFSKASTGGTPTTETNQNLPPLPDKSKLEYGYDAIGYGEVRPGYESNTGK